MTVHHSRLHIVSYYIESQLSTITVPNLCLKGDMQRFFTELTKK